LRRPSALRTLAHVSRRTSVDDLKRLILSFHSLIAIETVEEERVETILRDVASSLHQPLYTWSITAGLRRGYGPAIEGTTDASLLLRFIIEEGSEEAIYLLKDLAPHLGNPAVVRNLRELANRLTTTRAAIVLTGDPLELPRDLDSAAIRFHLQMPDERELLALVRSVVESVGARQHVHVDLSREDTQRLVRSLSGLTLGQARRVIAEAIIADGMLTAQDIDRVAKSKGEIIRQSGILEFFPTEQNTYDLGGFGRLKQWLDHARAGFLPEARAMNLTPPKGVLLVGVQGCGKSLAAKFIARQWQLPLLKLDAGMLYDKYVGETEKRFRKAVALAESMAPVVLWIDEIEKAFGTAGSNDSDGGLSLRLFGSLLTWLQDKSSGVFVVGAANDLMRLPPELLRKGRFDEIFFVDLPTVTERRQIFEIHLRKRKQEVAKFDLDALAAASDGFSGAEIEQAVVASLYRALHGRRGTSTEDVLESLRTTVPLSVTRREDVERLRRDAVGRFTPVA
jgi:hypothetical protein